MVKFSISEIAAYFSKHVNAGIDEISAMTFPKAETLRISNMQELNRFFLGKVGLTVSGMSEKEEKEWNETFGEVGTNLFFANELKGEAMPTDVYHKDVRLLLYSLGKAVALITMLIGAFMSTKNEAVALAEKNKKAEVLAKSVLSTKDGEQSLIAGVLLALQTLTLDQKKQVLDELYSDEEFKRAIELEAIEQLADTVEHFSLLQKLKNVDPKDLN